MHLKNLKLSIHKNSRIIMLTAIISLAVLSFIYYKITSTAFSPDTTEKFFKVGEEIISEADTIMTNTLNNYQNNDFSDEAKKEINSELASLKDNKLSKFSNIRYSNMVSKLNNIISETEKCVKSYTEADSAKDTLYTSLNSNYYTLQTYTSSYQKSMLDFFRQNNISYVFDQDTDTIHYQFTEEK